MNISILSSEKSHPINSFLKKWILVYKKEHKIDLIRNKIDLKGGDILFLISCSEIISSVERSKYKEVLVIHASKLPEGRGWSPHIWQIIEGTNEIYVTLLFANDEVDTGDIVSQIKCHIPSTDTFTEINSKIFEAELELMSYAVNNYKEYKPIKQNMEITPTYFRKRKPSDSEIDINMTIKDQFNKLRVADHERYPSYFYFLDTKYTLTLNKVQDEE